jgi:small subunit ribosomal protein S18
MASMVRYGRFFTPQQIGMKMQDGSVYIDYKNVDELRRLLSANGKLLSRQRTRLPAMLQRHAARAIKRARYMALLPYDSELR